MEAILADVWDNLESKLSVSSGHAYAPGFRKVVNSRAYDYVYIQQAQLE